MNLAIFQFTMRRYFHWRTVLSGALLLITWSISVAALLYSNFVVAHEWARSMLFGPIVPMIVAVSIISPHFANSQQRKDGEYLSLIFSRPISKCSYVVSKWLSGSALIIGFMLVTSVFAFGIVSLCGGQPWSIVDGYAISDLILNALSYTALIVLISSLPSPWGYWVFGWFWVCCVFVTMGIGTMSFITSFSLSEFSRSSTIAAQFFMSFFSSGIDTYHVVKSSPFPLVEFIIYFSNLVLYLTLSTYAMSRREFFYAND